MRLLEYQAKELFKEFGIRTPASISSTDIEKGRKDAKELGYPFVIKVQVPVGGRGKAGGVGTTFNFGEMTLTRATVRLDSGISGVAYVQGRSTSKAEQSAVLDAMLQDERYSDNVLKTVIKPLEKFITREKVSSSRKAANTKVEFFTMVRGK